jgi:hypothetical protein
MAYGHQEYGQYYTQPPPPLYQQYPPFQPQAILSDEERLMQICRKHDISGLFEEKIKQKLGEFEIIIIIDNSGSMSQPAHEGFAKTRWQELRETCSVVISVASAVDKNGVDLYFLNPQCGQKVLYNVKDPTQIDQYFSIDPTGGTPLTETLEFALNDKLSKMDQSQKLLVLIATDGEPTGRGGIPEFKRVLTYGRNTKKVFVSILACTDDKACLRYLNKWDKKIPALDVVDDYFSERKQIQKVQGKYYKFSFGDYVVKSLLGSVDKWFDNLDERKKCIVM